MMQLSTQQHLTFEMLKALAIMLDKPVQTTHQQLTAIIPNCTSFDLYLLSKDSMIIKERISRRWAWKWNAIEPTLHTVNEFLKRKKNYQLLHSPQTNKNTSTNVIKETEQPLPQEEDSTMTIVYHRNHMDESTIIRKISALEKLLGCDISFSVIKHRQGDTADFKFTVHKKIDIELAYELLT